MITITSKKIIVLTTILTFVSVVFGQDLGKKTDKTQAKVKAEKIIVQAKSSINKGIKSEALNAIEVEFKSKRTYLSNGQSNGETNHETTFSVLSPNQIRVEEYSDFQANQQLHIEILNFSKYSISSDVLIDGKPFYFSSNLSSITPQFTKVERVDSIRYKVFNTIFPIILQSNWFQNLELEYIGEAESKDFKANIIEITLNNKKSRLFFDKESHLPVLMIQKFIYPTTKEEIERKTYFTDYKEISGLLVAHKVIIKTGETTTEERQLKKLEINPTFKPNLFEVKEDRINPY